MLPVVPNVSSWAGAAPSPSEAVYSLAEARPSYRTEVEGRATYATDAKARATYLTEVEAR